MLNHLWSLNWNSTFPRFQTLPDPCVYWAQWSTHAFPHYFSVAFDDGDSMLRLRLVSESPISALGHSLIFSYVHTDVWQLYRVTCGLCLSVAKRRRHWNPKSHGGECGRTLHWGPAFSRGLWVWLIPCSMQGPRKKAPSLSQGIKIPWNQICLSLGLACFSFQN